MHVGQARQALPEDLQHERLPLLRPVLAKHVEQPAAPPSALRRLLRVRRSAGCAVVPEHQPLRTRTTNFIWGEATQQTAPYTCNMRRGTWAYYDLQVRHRNSIVWVLCHFMQ